MAAARSARRQQILSALADGPLSATALASRLNTPAASIRRSIGELRERGYDVNSTPEGYVHTASPVTLSATTTPGESN